MEEGTATTPPRARSYIIKRPRLTKILDESEARILLLVAPAGYGKTTLAREWLEGKEGVAWYSAGPSMADVAALAAGIAEALSSADDELTDRIRSVAASSQSPEVLARAIAASEAAKKCVILVLDDCHHAADSEDATSFLSELVARTEFTLIATSRVRPSWLTPRMTVYGEVSIIAIDELAFTDDEAREVLGAAASQPDAFLAEAGGWPAVIGLAAMKEARGPMTAAVRPDDLYEFFADNLFDAAPLELQRALNALALGADSSLEVAAEFLGAEHERVLHEGQARGLLTLGSDRVTIHPLLKSFLWTKLRALERAQLDSTVADVVTALAKHGRWSECLATLEEFPESRLITWSLDLALVDLLASGRVATVKRWLRLGASHQPNDPTLLLAEAEVAIREGDERSAQALGERAGALLGRGDPAARAYLVAGRAAHLLDDSVAATHNCTRAEELAVSMDTKVQAQWIQVGSAIEQGDRDPRAIYERMEQVVDPSPAHAVRLHYARALIAIDLDHDPQRALREFDLASGLLPRVREPMLRTALLHMYAHVALILGHYERSLDLVEQQVSEAKASGLEFTVDHGLVTRASALIGVRKLRSAQKIIAELESRSLSASDFIARNTNLQAVRLRIALGDLERAEILLRRRWSISGESWPEQLGYRGLVLIGLGATREGKEVLFEACKRARTFDATAIIRLGQTAGVLATQRSAEGLAATAFALLNAIERGCTDAVVTACRAYPELVRASALDSRTAQALTEVLVRSRDFDLGRQAGLEMPREFRRNVGLSPREFEVYELLAQGRSNGEIAQTLFISKSTTKVHVRHIFEKLGVHSRVEAASANPEDL